MSNFIEAFKAGKAGLNFGLTTGIDSLDRAINGIQRGASIGLAAAPKCGKTTFADFAFVISPYLQMLKLNKLNDIEWIYLSYEIDRVSKEFKFAAFFMAHDYNVWNYEYKGFTYGMDMDYLMGRKLHKLSDSTSELIPVSSEHEIMLKEIYAKRIVPLFGEYDSYGRKIKAGKIDLIEEAENPTGIDKYLKSHARKNGKFITESYIILNEKGQQEVKTRIIGYTPNNPKKFTIVIIDHIRKPLRERGFTMKENIDKLLEYTTISRNICKYTHINICHSNRGITNVERLKFAGEYIFPTADDVKDTGNLAEESTILMTMFNPNDEKYNLEKHFGYELKDYPNYRSIHITESRNTPSPMHVFTNMYGGVNTFTSLNQY